MRELHLAIRVDEKRRAEVPLALRFHLWNAMEHGSRMKDLGEEDPQW